MTTQTITRNPSGELCQHGAYADLCITCHPLTTVAMASVRKAAYEAGFEDGFSKTHFDSSDMILIAQEMEAAFRKYADSAALLSSLEETPGQFANAISGQRQMAHACAVIASKAKGLRGFTE